jgi:hypothetical protein
MNECHTPFQSYRTQLCNDSDNSHFKFHVLLREMHKAICAITECKKKTLISRGEKKMKKLFLGTVSHTIRQPARLSKWTNNPDYICSARCRDIMQ